MRYALKNFTGGEVSHSLAARYDLQKFLTSCRHMENFLPELHGPLSRRSGSYFLEDLGAPAVLLPFEFSSDPSQNYVLILQEGRIRVAQKYGYVRDGDGNPLEMEAPYLAGQLYDLDYAQSGDVVYLAHTAHALRKIMRYAHTDWRLEQVAFEPSISQPASVTVAFSGAAGGYPLRYKVAAVNSKGESGRASPGLNPNAKHANDWVVGDYATVTWSAVAGAESYNIYREDAGAFGYVGTSEGTSFRDDKYVADVSDTPREPQNPFAGGNNPGVVCFHQQRLVLAAPAAEPQKWYASRTGNFEDFSTSRPVHDDDSLEFLLASGRIDRIQWAAAFGDLLIGTAGSEYKAIGADQGVITPSSLNVREQSFWGSIKLRPLIIGNSVLHVQRQGSRVRDLFYSLERDGYAGNDLSVMAPHLFNNHIIRQWDYQQAPGSRVWAVREDGLLLCLTYLKEHDIWGWCRVGTQGGYRSVAVTAGEFEDDVYVVAERDIAGQSRWFLERFMPSWRGRVEDAFFVDCGLSYENQEQPIQTVGGLEHLEGRRVAILADGSPEEEQTVVDGQIELQHPAAVIHVGLPYVSLVRPQTPEADLQRTGSTLGAARNYGDCMIHLLDSVGGKYGLQPDRMFALPFQPESYGLPVPPFTGFLSFTPDLAHTPEGEIWFAQDLPLPFTIAALVLDVK
ncbi:MAG: hypothetical protein LBO77_05795 [Desulfovibrio sp.]|jgi:hypothetical protein|nr:hypothetical protein [Desulfovibrio sp.]